MTLTSLMLFFFFIFNVFFWDITYFIITMFHIQAIDALSYFKEKRYINMYYRHIEPLDQPCILHSLIYLAYIGELVILFHALSTFCFAASIACLHLLLYIYDCIHKILYLLKYLNFQNITFRMCNTLVTNGNLNTTNLFTDLLQ